MINLHARNGDDAISAKIVSISSLLRKMMAKFAMEYANGN